MPLKPQAPPLAEDVLDRDQARRNRFTPNWERYWQAIVDAIAARPQILAVYSISNQNNTIALTTLQTREVLPNGLYRLTGYVVPIQGIVHGAYANVFVTWTSGGATFRKVVVDQQGPPELTGESGSILMRIDQGATVQWEVVYHTASFPAQRYVYGVDLVLERLL